MQARDVMTKSVVSIGVGHSIRHAVLTMLEHHISGVPVLDDDQALAGMLTEGDLIRRAELGMPDFQPVNPGQAATNAEGNVDGYVKSRSWRVSDVMTRDLITVGEDASLAEIARLMREKGIKRIPVMRDGVMVGIVSRADLLRGIVAADEDQTALGDEAIQRAVNTRLHAELGLSPTLTGAKVEDRQIILWGQVTSEAQREAARVAAESIRGINGVTNNITVVDKIG